MNSYSFLNVNASINGPGFANLNLGSGAAAAEEGITIEASGDKNVMTEGADGKVQHTLVASNAGKVTIRLLKVSPTNGLLMIAYNLQKASSRLWGQNIIAVTDPNRGDAHICQVCAFTKKPSIVYDKAGPMLEWVFDSAAIESTLGIN